MKSFLLVSRKRSGQHMTLQHSCNVIQLHRWNSTASKKPWKEANYRYVYIYIWWLYIYTWFYLYIIFPSVFYPTFPEFFFVSGNQISVDPPLLWGNGGAVALANAFAMGCGEKLQTIILDENDIGAAGGSNMRFIWFTHDFLGRWKRRFFTGETCWGRVWKIGFVEDSSVFVPEFLGGKDSNDSSYLHP